MDFFAPCTLVFKRLRCCQGWMEGSCGFSCLKKHTPDWLQAKTHSFPAAKFLKCAVAMSFSPKQAFRLGCRKTAPGLVQALQTALQTG